MAKSKANPIGPAIRRNWGWWDGQHARERGRLPIWSPLYSGGRHPYDQTYGRAFWQGWNNENHPNTGRKLPDKGE